MSGPRVLDANRSPGKLLGGSQSRSLRCGVADEMRAAPTPTGPNVFAPHSGERRRDVLTCEVAKLAPSPSGARDGTGALFAREAVDRA
jgi:hypothetical protein